MSRYDCHRCDWRPATDDDAKAQLVEHAVQTRHWLCSCCGRSLPAGAEAVCLPCVADTRQRLASIVGAYAMLPLEYRRPATAPVDVPAGLSDETPLPGGDALSMSAVGSEGSYWRGRPPAATLDGTPWRPVLALRPDGGHWVEAQPNDNHPEDAPAIAFELSRWEDDWREVRGEPVAMAEASVVGCVGYLVSHLDWAAQQHPAFQEFATDVRRLLSRLATTTAMAEFDNIGAACLTCDTDLRRTYGEPKPCHHTRPDLTLQVIGWTVPEPEEEPKPIHETVRQRDERVQAWELQHRRCDQGGLEPTWHCPRCRRVYDEEEYNRAVAAEMRTKRDGARYWVSVALAARLVNRTQATIRRWIEDDREAIEVACDMRSRRMQVLLSSVFAASARRARRKRVA